MDMGTEENRNRHEVKQAKTSREAIKVMTHGRDNVVTPKARNRAAREIVLQGSLHRIGQSLINGIMIWCFVRNTVINAPMSDC